MNERASDRSIEGKKERERNKHTKNKIKTSLNITVFCTMATGHQAARVIKDSQGKMCSICVPSSRHTQSHLNKFHVQPSRLHICLRVIDNIEIGRERERSIGWNWPAERNFVQFNAFLRARTSSSFPFWMPKKRNAISLLPLQYVRTHTILSTVQNRNNLSLARSITLKPQFK